MCDSIRFKGGNAVMSIRQFQEIFKVDATQYGWGGDEQFLDCCMCEINLDKYFKDNPQHKFYYDAGEWWQE